MKKPRSLTSKMGTLLLHLVLALRDNCNVLLIQSRADIRLTTFSREISDINFHSYGLISHQGAAYKNLLQPYFYTCLDVDFCQSSPCNPMATCVNIPGGGFNCICNATGFTGDGFGSCEGNGR